MGKGKLNKLHELHGLVQREDRLNERVGVRGFVMYCARQVEPANGGK